MAVYSYAQIDNGTVIGLSDLSGQIDDDNMILITLGRDVQIGDIYHKDTDIFTRPHGDASPDMPPVTNEQLAQQMSALEISLISAGVI